MAGSIIYGVVSGYTLAFGLISFIGVVVGCLAAVLILRRRFHFIPTVIVAIGGAALAAVLLAIFPTMPQWPFTAMGVVLTWWVIASAGLMAVFTYVATLGLPGNR